jgi:hypothetical protein
MYAAVQMGSRVDVDSSLTHPLYLCGFACPSFHAPVQPLCSFCVAEACQKADLTC